MDFTKEQIEEIGLSEDQVKKVQVLTNDNEATLKGGWDATANEQAEGILTGAIKYAQTENGFTLERNQGEKAGDWFKRFSGAYLSPQKTDLEKAKSDYEDKMKNVKGNEALTKEYDDLKIVNDDLLKKYADYDTLKEVSDKYEPLSNEYKGMKKRVAYNSVKPRFADSVNEYEAATKWGEFIADVEKDYTIAFDGDKAIAISKENKHVVKDLKDLVSSNTVIKELIKGRQQRGPNSQQANLQDIEGIPFQVPEGADSITRGKLIRDYLATKGLNPMSNEHAVKFAELNDKMLQKTA